MQTNELNALSGGTSEDAVWPELLEEVESVGDLGGLEMPTDLPEGAEAEGDEVNFDVRMREQGSSHCN